MGQLTDEMVQKICHFRDDIVEAFLADLNAHAEVDSLAAPGALDLDILVSEISVDGTDAFTLAAPSRTGQRKIIRCVAATNTPVGTLTITSPDTTVGYVCPSTFVFDQAGQDIELEATGALKWRWVGGTIERFVDAVVAPGACSLVRIQTTLAVDGTDAFTLAAPTRVGQRKVITCISGANTPAGTLTVTSPDDTAGFVCAASFFFDTAGQEIELVATSGLKWRAVAKKRTGRKTLVLGTTVTTGICNMSHVNVTVDGTKASTGSSALPNGSAVGEVCSVTCSAAINTPHGDLGGAYIADDGTTAKTLLDDFTAETDYALLRWNGTAWELMGMQGATLALA